MRSYVPVRRRIMPIVLLMALTACSGAGSLQITRYVDIERPPESGQPVLLSDTTYAVILGKGYARIGSFFASQQNSSEAAIVEAVLGEARQLGAAAVRISTDSGTIKGYTGATKSRFVTTIDSKGNYNTKFDPGRTVKVETSTTAYANVELFARDPALAARQLKEGPERWARKVASTHEKRSIMFAKLSTLMDKLRRFDASQLNLEAYKPGAFDHEDYVIQDRRLRDQQRGMKSLPGLAADDPALAKFPYWARLVQIAADEIASREHCSSYFEGSSNCWESHYFDGGVVAATTLQRFAEGTQNKTPSYFKDPSSPQVKELHALVLDVQDYAVKNWEFLRDNTEDLQEHIVFKD
ncbi:MAG: hypothetical protein M0036_12895 [Desulfobacteraceae bacterium]|nr:hypothetical protein [Desulfobacteraceae bacterium]